MRRHRWAKHYPDDIARFGGQLDAIGVAIIREIFRQSAIPEAYWDRASGGYASGEGTAFLNFVHYDTRTTDWGLRAHTDYGFVTILDAMAPGLQIELEGEFHDVPVLPGHFVINFGEALNFVTSYAARGVGAVVHRVLSQQPADSIRHGIVYFANPDLDGMLWQFDINGKTYGVINNKAVRSFICILRRSLLILTQRPCALFHRFGRNLWEPWELIPAYEFESAPRDLLRCSSTTGKTPRMTINKAAPDASPNRSSPARR